MLPKSIRQRVVLEILYPWADGVDSIYWKSREHWVENNGWVIGSGPPYTAHEHSLIDQRMEIMGQWHMSRRFDAFTNHHKLSYGKPAALLESGKPFCFRPSRRRRVRDMLKGVYHPWR